MIKAILTGPFPINPHLQTGMSAAGSHLHAGTLLEFEQIEAMRSRFLESVGDSDADAFKSALTDVARKTDDNSHADAVAWYLSDGALLMAAAGKFKTALAVADHLKATSPYNHTHEGKTVLNPKRFAAYASAHTSFDPHPLKTRGGVSSRVRLFATNIGGTLMREGEEPDIQAISELRSVLQDIGATLLFITGKSYFSALRDMSRHAVLMPHYLSTEVGTRMYLHDGENWEEMRGWYDLLRSQWPQSIVAAVDEMMAKVPGAKLRDFAQSHFKRSFLLPPSAETSISWRNRLAAMAKEEGLDVSVQISSEKDGAHVNFHPPAGTKLGILHHIMEHLGIKQEEAVFAGYSGIDVDIMAAGMRSIFVGSEEGLADILKSLSNVHISQEHHIRGVLEGLAHFGLR